MNSSGIKRGLAAGAVAALAVTGLPFLASSAHAAGTASLVSSGPTRNGGDVGGMQVVVVTGLPDADPGTAGIQTDADLLKIANSALTSTTGIPGNPTFVSAPVFTGGGGNGAFTASVRGGLPTDGDTLAYALWYDIDDDGVVDGDEPRVQVSNVLTGAPASVEIDPVEQTTTGGTKSGLYTATVKDAAGRVTQLSGSETATLTSNSADTSFNWIDQLASQTGVEKPYTVALTAAQNPMGTVKFNATDTSTAPVTRTLTANLGGKTATAKLNIAKTATGLTAADLDVVTGADTWNGFGGGAFGTPVSVRVDQGTIKLDIADNDTTTPAPNGGASLVVTFTGTGGVTFGGKTSTTQLVSLDAAAKGTVSVTPDAGSITEDGGINVTSSAFGGTVALTYDRPTASAATTAPDAKAYVTKIGGTTAVTVTVKDQFGNPVTSPAQVALVRAGRTANNGTTPRVTPDASGKAVFNLVDAGTTAGSETFTINLYKDQFDASPVTGIAGGTITYNADGVGPAFSATAGTASILPLTDGAANAGTDASVITVGASTAGVPNAAATVSVDNGALILGASANLDKATPSKSIQLDAAGGATFTVVGTKTGPVTVTITSGGVTKTVALTVAQAAAGGAVIATARNVALEGPEGEKAVAGSTVTFTATVTDAFGNPVAGVPVAHLPLVVNGPANLQSSDAATNAAGKLTYTVLLTDNANSAVTARVTGINPSGSATPTPQFGAAADSVTGTTKTEPGLTASQNTDSVTISDVVNLRQLEQAVADAEDAVDEAQADVDAANDDLVVAQAEKKVAQQAVKAAKQDLKKAKKQKKGVKAAKKELRSAKAQLTIAKAKVSSAQNKVTRAEAKLTKAQAELEAAEQALEDAQS